MSLEKEFVPYQQSIDMKLIGFDDECIAIFTDGKLTIHGKQSLDSIKGSGLHNRNLGNSGRMVTAPLYQQCFQWFRKKHKLEGLILPQDKGAIIDEEPVYFIAIISYKNNKMEELFNSTNKQTLLHYNPREEAEFACLKKLIDIVKEK